MDDQIEDDVREALVGLSSLPPHRKAHSYSQQHRAFSTQKRCQQVRKHSLDDDRISNNIESFYDSGDDDFFLVPSTNLTAIAINENLDRRPSMDASSGPNDLTPCHPLPEFIGSSDETGIFKVPIRAAIHPSRPPCLELRPHPLRETQVGKFLRNIIYTEKQLWAGQENGVRVWEFQNAFALGCGLGGKVRRGDENAAPFYESVDTPPTICLTVDSGNKLIWSGHKDGKIRSWKTDQPFSSLFKEGLSWQAHKGPVLAMVISSFGKDFSFFFFI